MVEGKVSLGQEWWWCTCFFGFVIVKIVIRLASRFCAYIKAKSHSSWLKPCWLAHMYWSSVQLGSLGACEICETCETLVCCTSCIDAADTELGSILAFWHDIDILIMEQRVEYRTNVSQNPTRSECQQHLLRLNSTTLGACTLNLHNLNWVSGCSVPLACARGVHALLRSSYALCSLWSEVLDPSSRVKVTR